MRTVISLTFGVLLAYVAGSVLGTQVVLNNVASMGLEVTLAMRWSSSLSDVAGLAGTLLPLMVIALLPGCLLYTSPSPRDATLSRMPSSA